MPPAVAVVAAGVAAGVAASSVLVGVAVGVLGRDGCCFPLYELLFWIQVELFQSAVQPRLRVSALRPGLPQHGGTAFPTQLIVEC